MQPGLQIITLAEARALGLTQYYTGKPCKWGHDSPKITSNKSCLECNRERCRENMRVRRATDVEFAERDRERVRERDRLKRATDVEFAERHRERVRKYDHLHPEKKNARRAKRRALKQQATPAWLTPKQLADMEDLFKIAKFLEMFTGRPHHVDHLAPLNCEEIEIDGVWVPAICGLHAPWNLQVVDGPENMSKGNKFIPELCLPDAVFCIPCVAISAIPVLIERHHELEQYLNPRPRVSRKPLQPLPEGPRGRVSRGRSPDRPDAGVRLSGVQPHRLQPPAGAIPPYTNERRRA